MKRNVVIVVPSEKHKPSSFKDALSILQAQYDKRHTFVAELRTQGSKSVSHYWSGLNLKPEQYNELIPALKKIVGVRIFNRQTSTLGSILKEMNLEVYEEGEING